jgi:ketosteroid isomerase-like protein
MASNQSTELAQADVTETMARYIAAWTAGDMKSIMGYYSDADLSCHDYSASSSLRPED